MRRAKLLAPDLALVDVQMPVMDGVDLALRLRETAPNVKLIFLTVHESQQMVRRMLETGACGYVLKSEMAGQLVRAITLVSRGQSFLSPQMSNLVTKSMRIPKAEASNHNRSPEVITAREREIIRLLAEGKSNKQIAPVLGISARTVETHRSRIMLKLGLHSLPELFFFAMRNRVISPPL